MPTTILAKIASLIIARQNCIKSGNTEWFERHTDTLRQIEREHLPSGSGIDHGTRINLTKSSEDRIILMTAFHHMDEGGGYDGWTEHEVIITPSLAFGFHVRITGRNRNDIKSYLSETFQHALSQIAE
jgi:hypothetical protein